MNKPARSIVYQEIASAIGRESARKLVEAFGGTEIFVPKSIGPKHPIAQAIGAESAEQLSTYFHGTELALPAAGRRRRRVKELAKSGDLSRRTIAIETGYTERQVYRILGEEADDRQGDLFGEGNE